MNNNCNEADAYRGNIYHAYKENKKTSANPSTDSDGAYKVDVLFMVGSNSTADAASCPGMSLFRSQVHESKLDFRSVCRC